VIVHGACGGKKMRRILLASLLAAVVMAIGTTPASALGTVFVNPPPASILRPPLQFICSDSAYQEQRTTTPSGQTIYFTKGTMTFSISSLTQSLNSTTNYTFHSVIGPDGSERQLMSLRSNSLTLDGVTCYATYNFHLANGEVRHDVQATNCS